ncbi:MAG: DNA polymerase III subunit delta' [Firmicutes bacterium]|nr:DNA polymerase III subunit delta' [Bacillota bacterium]
MLLREILGQDIAVNQLQNALRQNRISHGYLFVGPDGVGKRTTALAFAQALNCLTRENGDGCGRCASCLKLAHGNHPNLHLIEPEGSTLRIQQIRAVQQSAQYRQLDAGWKVFVFLEADKLTLPAANSLLKVLEEPPANTVLILITKHTFGLLPTVLSRCQKISFTHLSASVIRELLITRHWLPAERASFVAALAGGNMTTALAAAESGELLQWREEAIGFLATLQTQPTPTIFQRVDQLERERERLGWLLETMILWCRDALLWQETHDRTLLVNTDKVEEIMKVSLNSNQLVQVLQALHEARRYLQQNANVRLTLESLFIELHQIILGGNLYHDRSCGDSF